MNDISAQAGAVPMREAAGDRRNASDVAPTREAIGEVYHRPLLLLVSQAAAVHQRYHPGATVQCASLLSVKTGSCPEDCAYCPQSARHNTDVQSEPLLPLDDVVAAATRAKLGGADRFCMGAAWRAVKDGPQFERVLEMVRQVKSLGLETCVTLGMLQPHQARQLRDAGLDYYNHNLDTSPEFYPAIINTRTYDDRLQTLAHVRDAGLNVCCGGIIGMGEGAEDRIGLLQQLASQDPQPKSVPINALVAVPGTKLGNRPPVAWDELVRMVATARVVLPEAMIRLSAGRRSLSEEAQAMCFLAGANSIFLGERLLTTDNAEPEADHALLAKLGLRALGDAGDQRASARG